MSTSNEPRVFRLDIDTETFATRFSRSPVYGCQWPEWEDGLVIVMWHPDAFGLVMYSSIDALKKSPEYNQVTDLVWLDQTRPSAAEDACS